MTNNPPISIIVATDINGAIGKDNNLLCHLSADLKHFKTITMGHAIIMGRKTFESLPKGALPGRRNIIITRNTDYVATDATVCHSIEEAIMATADESERFIIGGGELYNSTLDIADKIYLTVINHSFSDADTWLKAIDYNDWDIILREDYEADEKNPFPFSFINLSRK